MALEAILGRPGMHRVVIQQTPHGAYIWVWERPDSSFAEKDYLQDDLEMALRSCELRHGIPRDRWKEIADLALKRSAR